MTDWLHWINLAGVAVCSVSGGLMAYQKRMDGFGVIVLASVTGIGGGTLRDLMLDVPVFWTVDPDFLWAVLLAALLTIVWLRITPRFPYHYLLIADAFGLAFFNVVGIEKALDIGAAPVIAIAMGTITGVFGGMLRDVIAREVPLVMEGELYALACIVGGIVYTSCHTAGLPSWHCAIAAMITTLIIRLMAMRWHWEWRVFKD